MDISPVKLVRRQRAYREAVDIVAATLHAILRGEGTNINIQNSADLSPSQMKRCLLLSLDSGLLTVDQRNTWIYRITQKGLRFLDLYEKISGMIRYTEELKIN